MSESVLSVFMGLGSAFSGGLSGQQSTQSYQQNIQQQLWAQQWSGNKIENYGHMLQNAAYKPRPATVWETDYAEAMSELDKIAPGFK